MTEEATETWVDGFEPETKAYIENKGWGSPSDLLTSYQNLEKLSGGSKQIVALPGDDATDEDYANFYGKLGRPEKYEDYKFEATDNIDESLLTWFQKTAHENGLSMRQAKAFYENWNNEQTLRNEQQQTLRIQNQQREIDMIKSELGEKYDEQIHNGQQVVKALGFNEETLSQWESKMGTTDFMKLFLALGSKMGEDNFVTGESGGGFNVSVEEATLQLNELNNDPAFMKRYLDGDKDAIAKYQRVMQNKYRQ